MSTLPVFAAASLALLMIPGPAVLYIVARSSAQGPKAGIVSVLGVHTGSIIHVLAATVGLSAVVMASSLVFTAVKTLGGVYLVVLGVRTIMGARAVRSATPPPPKPLRRLYLDGLVVNVLNPKVALFFLAFLPQFVSKDHGPIWSQTLVLGVLYIVLGLASDAVYALVGGSAGRWFAGRAGARSASKYVEGGLLIGLGLTALVLPHRRTAD